MAPSLRLTPQRRRRSLSALGAALVIVTSTAVATAAYLQASHRVAVLAVRRAIAPGEAIAPQDLAVVHVATSPQVEVIPSRDARLVVGRRAAVALLPGTLLAPGALSGARALAVGSSMVGVALKPGELPAGGLEVGDQVMVVLTAGTSGIPITGSATGGAAGGQAANGNGPNAPSIGAPSETGLGTVLAPDAVVSFVGPPGNASTGSDTQVVSLSVPQALAPSVATAAVAGQVSLVLLPAS